MSGRRAVTTLAVCLLISAALWLAIIAGAGYLIGLAGGAS